MPISDKQKSILAFSYTNKYQALICDGAVRTGKTSLMVIAFVDWAMREFNNTNFGICGKTVGSAIKNMIVPYMATAYSARYKIHFTRSDNKMIVRHGKKTNVFYVYGGKDESSYMLIQGITLAGVLLDEVALMTRSFVEQALARCISYKNRRYWFNCNPGAPKHWFRQEWLLQPQKHRALHLHLLMDDNPALDEETIREARNTWSGVFYKRYVLGEWVEAEGLIYKDFDEDRHVFDTAPSIRRISYGVDVGHSNATAFLAIGEGADGRAYILDEYYHSGRASHETRSPARYAADFVAFRNTVSSRHSGALFNGVYVDPSATGFIQQLREAGISRIYKANNDVVPGIQTVSSIVDCDLLRVHRSCTNTLNEFSGYAWDDKAAEKGEDAPVKIDDHAMDALRYYFHTRNRDWIGRRVTPNV